ncbi:MAG: hypothetical protein M1836_001105 [Candelina mexicana]|nr:MAG: hypothetical protein M1836_001105 [Candelina mexicana]
MSLNPSHKARNNGLWQPKLSNTSQEALIATQNAEKLRTKSFLQEVSKVVKELDQEAQLQSAEVFRLKTLAGEVESKQRAHQARLADLFKLLERQIEPVAPTTNADATDQSVRDVLEQRRVILSESPVQASGSRESPHGDRGIKQPSTSNSDIPNTVVPQKATSNAKATQRESANVLGATTTVRPTSGLGSSSRRANTDRSGNGEETRSQQLQRSSTPQRGSLVHKESELVNSGSTSKNSGLRSPGNAAVVGTESAIPNVPVTQGPKATLPVPSLNSNIEVVIDQQNEHLGPVNPNVNEPRIPDAVLGRLPRPPPMIVPEEPVFFPPSFFREEALGGNDTVFARVSRKKQRDQVYPCPEMIKVDPAQHQYAPLIGEHGALNFVEGEEFTGKIGEQYPLFRRGMLSRSWEYIGEYRVVHHMTVEPGVWKTWTISQRRYFALRIFSSAWGQNLLRETGLLDEYDALEIRLWWERENKPGSTIIMDFFDKEEEPCLRMSWTVVQCVGYNKELKDSLSEAYKDYEMYLEAALAELSDSADSEISQDGVDGVEDEENKEKIQDSEENTEVDEKKEEGCDENECDESNDGASPEMPQLVETRKRKFTPSRHTKRGLEKNYNFLHEDFMSINELMPDLTDKELAEYLRFNSDDSGPDSYQASGSDQENAERPRKRPRRSHRLSESFRRGKARRKRQVL